MSNSNPNPSSDDSQQDAAQRDTIRFSTAIPEELANQSTTNVPAEHDPYKTDLFKTAEPVAPHDTVTTPPVTDGFSTFYPEPSPESHSLLQQKDISKSINPRNLLDHETKQSQITESKVLVPTRRLARSQESIQELPTDYQLVDVLGQGGMGTVFLARQVSLDRLVALKVVKPIDGDQARRLAGEGKLDQATKHRRDQFLAEAIVTGDLDHPNIVPIHDLAKTDNDTLFYAMKKVDGIAWSHQIRKKPLQENLEILLKVCDAVAFAHSRGIVHRDIKPENVMLGDFGVVLLMDWGLAVSKANYSKRTTIYQSTSLGGSPAYMAPEMAKGPVEAIGPASDIYLLGATLYEIVVGRAPHTGRNVSECLRAVSNNEILDVPDNLREHELLRVAFKAMATEVNDRFASVSDLQSAIREYRAHAESLLLSHRADEVWQRAKESQEYSEYARALFGFEESLKLWPENRNAGVKAIQVRLDYANTAYQNADLDLGISLLDSDNSVHRPLLQKLREAQRDRQHRTSRVKQLRALAAALLAFIFFGGAAALYLIKQERDQALLAKAEEEKARTQAEKARDDANYEKNEADKARDAANNARMIADKAKSAETQAKLAALDAKDAAERNRNAANYEAYVAEIGLAKARIEQNEFDGARTILEQIHRDDDLRSRIGWEWEWLTRQANQSTSSVPLAAPAKEISMGRDRDAGLVIDIQGRVYTFTITDALHVQLNADPLLNITQATSAAVSPNADRYAIGLNTGNILILNANTHEIESTCQGHTDSVNAIEFFENKTLVSASQDRSVRVWDTNTAKELAAGWHLTPVHAICTASSDGAMRVLCAASDQRSGHAVLWSYQNSVFQKIADFAEHRAPVTAVSLTSDGQVAASGDRSGSVLIWEPDQIESQSVSAHLASVVNRLRDNESSVPKPQTRIAKTLLSPLAVDKLKLLTVQELEKQRAHSDLVTSLQFTPSGKELISSSADYTSKLWDVKQQSMIKALRGHGRKVVRAVHLRKEPTMILSASSDATLRVWNTKLISTDSELNKPYQNKDEASRDEIHSIRFDHTGKSFLTASRDHSARLYNLASNPAQPFTLQKSLSTQFAEGSLYGIWSMTVDPPRNRLFVSTADGVVRCWNTKTGTELSSAQGIGLSFGLAVSPQGDFLVTSSGKSDAKALVWSISAEGSLSAEPRLRLQGHKAAVSAVAISSDATTVFTGDIRGEGLLWNLHTGAQIGNPILIHQGSRINTAHFHPQQSHVFIASDDNTLSEVEIPSGNLIYRYQHPGVVTHLSLNASGTKIATISEVTTGSQIDAQVKIWDHTSHDHQQLLKASTKSSATTSKATSTIPETTGRLSGIQFAPDSDRLAVAQSTPSISSVSIWDLSSKGEAALTQAFRFPTALPQLNGVCWQTSETIISSHGNAAFGWNLQSSQLQRSFRPHASLTEAAFSRDDHWIATGSGSIKIWNRETGNAVGKVEVPHEQRVESIDFHPDSKRNELASCGPDGVIRIWIWDPNTESVTLRREIALEPRTALHQVRFHPTGSRLIAAGDHGRAWICEADLDSPPILFTDEENDSPQSCIAWSPDGLRAMIGGGDRKARLWSLPQRPTDTVRLEAVFIGHAGPINDVDFIGEMDQTWRVITASEDKSVRVWDPRPVIKSSADNSSKPLLGRELLSLRQHALGVTSIDVSPDRRRLISAGRDGSVFQTGGDSQP